MGKLIYDKPLFLKTVWGAIAIVAMSVYGLIESSKEKEELKTISGQIEFIAQQYQNLPIRDFGKYRYIKINSEAKPFEIFTGKESGDFKPEMEKLDELKAGDEVVLYVNSIAERQAEIVSRSVEIIEHNHLSYYIAGNGKFKIFIFCLCAGLGLAVWAIIFKYLGKII